MIFPLTFSLAIRLRHLNDGLTDEMPETAIENLSEKSLLNLTRQSRLESETQPKVKETAIYLIVPPSKGMRISHKIARGHFSAEGSSTV